MSLRRFPVALLMISSLLILFLMPLAAPRHALALSNDAITITSQSNSVQFPDAITFNVSASDAASTFVSATIVVDLYGAQGAETHALPITGSLHTLRLTWKENTTGNSFLPPGSPVNYYWQFSDKAGDTFNQSLQQITTIDTRFNWQHLSQGLLQVNWYYRSLDFGQAILSQASANIQRISNTLGGGLLHAINLWVYETDADFHGSLPPSAYEWVGGVAFPSLDEASIVVVGLSDDTLVRDMPHELTHLVFHQLIENGEHGGVFVPTWFDEGLAVYNQLYHEPGMTSRFQQALATDSLLRLNDISNGFPANADKAYLAYAQSWNLLAYMYSTFGQPKMARLIKDMNNPQNDFDQDLTQALGLDEIHLENQWRLHLNQPGVLLPDQVTPTPQVKQKPIAQASSFSGDRSWVLIVLGAVLVVFSLACLIALFASLSRRRVGATLVVARPPTTCQYPATCMRAPLYTRPGIDEPPGVPPQDAPALPPRRQYPQE
ncbi:MAG TPA: peptidase MA family metallohydrolase [Ktedonobacteraceae bacterium]|nr:peptidase MA family metallohydrolase [Ktedonobacteraceae bacterium]